MMKFLKAALAALSLFAVSGDVTHAQSANPFNPDFAWCATQGAVATRTGTAWGCLTPGTSGQVLRTNGAGANVSWQTVTGTGTVTSVGLAMPSDFTVTNSPVTTAGTLTAAWASQAANLVHASPNGSSGAPTFRSLVAADLPTIPVSKGGTNATSAGGTALDNISGFATTGILRRTGAGTYSLGTTVSVAEGGTNATSASGTAVDNISGFAGTGILRRTGAGTYSQGTTVSVAEGGTGQTSGNGTSLDNISGMSGTGLVRRTGAGTYTQGTQVATGEIADGSITTAKLATPAASGASLVLLSTQNVTNAANITFLNVFSSTYSNYLIKFSGLMPLTDNTSIQLYQGTSGTFITTSYAVWGINKCADASAPSVTNLASSLFAYGLSNSSAYGGDGTIEVSRPSISSTTHYFRTNSTYVQSGVNFCWSQNTIGASGSNSFTDFRLLAASGNITGKVSVYGYNE